MKNTKQKLGDLGQHWTPLNIVRQLISLAEFRGSVLEPSSGSGAILLPLLKEGFQEVVGLEIDPSCLTEYSKPFTTIGDLFDFEGSFDTIIGNPPYVAGKLLTKEQLGKIEGICPKSANLYLHFIERCASKHIKKQGELIMIVPSTLFKLSRGRKLRSWMCANGNFTHYISPKVSWDNADVSTVIFRWVQGQNQGKVQTNTGLRSLFEHKGFVKLPDYVPFGVLGSYVSIGVGACSKKSLRKVGGQAFLCGGKIIHFDASDASKWPRWRVTEHKHKILFSGGPTRATTLFYLTEGLVEEKVSGFHGDSFLQCLTTPLPEVCKGLNEFFERRGVSLGCRVEGRFTVGIEELKAMPLDEELYHVLNG